MRYRGFDITVYILIFNNNNYYGCVTKPQCNVLKGACALLLMANSSEVLDPRGLALSIQDKFLGRTESSDVCLQKISSHRLSRSAPSAGGHLLDNERVLSCEKQEIVQKRGNGRVSYHEEERTVFTDEIRKMLELVPIGYVPLPHQVGGHSYFDGQIGERSIMA